MPHPLRESRLVLASENPKKRAELAELLAPLGIEVLTPADVGGLPEVIEDGATFAANAAKKALSAARASGHAALADDSGLLVEHLDGAPGVRSARYGGRHGDDAANNARLLAELQGVPAARRSARFVCALALAEPSGNVLFEVEGEARGTILEAPRGSRGFGYDPLFAFDEPQSAARGRTFAELTQAEKAVVSHRGRALARLVSLLRQHPTARG